MPSCQTPTGTSERLCHAGAVRAGRVYRTREGMRGSPTTSRASGFPASHDLRLRINDDLDVDVAADGVGVRANALRVGRDLLGLRDVQIGRSHMQLDGQA